MYFRKFPYSANFDFAQKVSRAGSCKLGRDAAKISLRSYEGGVHRISIASKQWKKNLSIANLKLPKELKKGNRQKPGIAIEHPFSVSVLDHHGKEFIRSTPGMAFGVCGARSMFMFEITADMQFYGMGEKMRGLELSGQQTKFWNTDIFADFNWKEIEADRPDPMYVSIPYVIIKRGNNYVGMLLDNPHATFISTGANINIGGGQMNLGKPEKKYLVIGAENGMPELYIITGPSLPELTRKLQQLVGVTPLPPAWALGYHQCRWGYKSDQCLEELDAKFTEHGIPCDGLWIDIDYMEAFKVFTFNKAHFPDLRGTLAKLKKNGRRLVPILDPGVKKQDGYNVYESGKKTDVFCRNPQGGYFVGLVWPGETVFPDFSLPEARRWWAKWVKAFASQGIHGAWIDMNDPSTGSVLNEDMLFARGKQTHDTFHNQYASGMAEATRAGFQAAHPGERPFLITRSGYTGISKYSAVWTGDNMSSYHYFRNCLAVSLNLALSGVPFNGPDVGGFAGDCTPQLMQDWIKACFLFPFCRNHSCVGTRHQEPWAFDEATLQVVKHYIQMRYALRPYLYNLFIQQELSGEAILRPLFYDFADSEALPLGRIDDSFMIGPAILQAPILSEHERTREVTLPGPGNWFSAMDGKWVEGNGKIKVTPGHMQTPLFLREGSIIPMARDLTAVSAFDAREATFLIMLRKDSEGPAVYEYVFDDGQSLEYRKGRRSRLMITATAKNGELHIQTGLVEKGYGSGQFSFTLCDQFDRVVLNGKNVEPKMIRYFFSGVDLPLSTVS